MEDLYICESWKLVREHFDKSYFNTLLILKVESFKVGEQWELGGGIQGFCKLFLRDILEVCKEGHAAENGNFATFCSQGVGTWQRRPKLEIKIPK